MKKVFAGLMALVTLLSCEQKKDETLVLYSEADFAGLRVDAHAGIHAHVRGKKGPARGREL